jgi:hypothetical protein
MAYINRMAGMDHIDQIRKYLDYLEKHLENVRVAFEELTIACKDMALISGYFSYNKLRIEVIYHDTSKFMQEEFIPYCNHFYPVDPKSKQFSKFHFGAAWEHHKNCNSHHHETAKDDIDIFHMVIDWTAMGYVFNDTPRQFYEKNKSNIKLSEKQKKFMYEIFDRLESYRLFYSTTN